MQLSYNRHTLDSIPEAHLQHEVWTSQGWATNLSQNFPSVPRPKRLRISQLPKTGKIRASLHDKPLQETKALRIVSKSKAAKERRSRFMWTKLLRSVNKTTFLRAVAYILPQLVCLQHHRGQVLPSLTGKETTNLPGVRIIRNVVYYLANRCTTESHSCIHLLNQVIIPMPPGPISVLQRIEAKLRSSSLMPQEAYKELITAVLDLLPTPNLVLVAAEAAIRKLTWRLPFIFDVPSRKACTLSTDQANDIYGSQKDIKKVHVDECTHQFKSQPEALQAMIDHVGIRFNRKDPTLFLDWVKLQTVLANEIQELIQASQSNDAEATLDEAGDVLYVASYGLRFSTGQQAGLAAVGEATVWSQMHYFSPTSETITLFLDNVARLQRLTTGGAEVTEIWWEAQSLGAQWCCTTGDDHTPTMSLDARLWGPPEQRDYADPPEQTIACYRIQLQAELQRLKESICLNSTRHAIPQARQALQQSLTTAQRLAYPLETMNMSQLDKQKSKPKIKETGQPPTAPESKIDTQQPQNSTPKPKIEQAEETAVLDPPHADTAALTAKAEKFQSQNSALKPEIERTEETTVLDSLHADIAALTVKASKFQSQNSAGSANKPKIESPVEMVAAMRTADHAEAQQNNTPKITGNSTMPASPGPGKKTPLLATEPGYTLSCHEEAADTQCWASHFQRNQTMERALRGVPEPARLESAAASAFRNQEPIERQQLANLRHQQCTHLPQALQEIQAGHKQTCWAWWAFPSDRMGRNEPKLNGLTTCLSESTACDLINQPPQDWRPLLEEIADTGWQTLLPPVDYP